MKKKKRFTGCNEWDFIIIEGKCGYSFMKNKYMYTAPIPQKSNGKLDFDLWMSKNYKLKYKKSKNHAYVAAKVPKYCKHRITIECLGDGKGKCPFFLYSQADYNEYLIKHIKSMRKYIRRKESLGYIT